MTDRRRSALILVAVLGLIAASLWAVISRPTQLGLDLQGGVQLVYEANPTPQVPEITPEALDRSLEIMRERVDQFGVAEPELLVSGNNQIELNLPGVDDPDRVAEQVGSTAQMFFYDWEPNVLDEDCQTNPDQVNGGETAITGLYNAVQRAASCEPRQVDAAPRAQPSYYAFDEISQRLLAGGPGQADREEVLEEVDPQLRDRVEVLEVPAGVAVVRDEQGDVPEGAPLPDRWWVILDRPVLSGTDIRNPEQSFDQGVGNEPIVTMEFTDEGREAFQRVTQRIAERGLDNAALNGGLTNPVAASHHFAIRLDEQLISTPYINFRENPEGIDGSTGASISGGFTIQSAQDLANLLKVGALPVDLDLISRSQVSATLGQQALDQGLVAGLAGFAIVVLFLMGFYRILGVIASVALGVYGLYLFALIELIPVTMTLPGIAGLILTIGVAADANIVIFERVKEEVRAGRSIPVAITQGYRKGFGTIFDANIVTLLVAFILFVLATAGVKGFALMLGLGVIVSLFTAVLATQAILLFLRGSRLLRSKSALGAGERHHKWTLDFMGASKWFFSASGIILLIGALSIAGKGLNFGIDFEAGARYTASLERSASVDEVRGALSPLGLSGAKVQSVENPELGANVVQISTEEAGQTEAISEQLDSTFGLTETVTGTEIGPTFGQTVAESALIAVVASLLVLGVYMTLRFEWKFALPVLIALSHDILITAGVYSLVGREVSTATVAALLTIMGYSLYDTIIVYDRIRENAPRMPGATFAQIMNRSLSEVLTRSLATSFSTLLPVAALLFFGGETLQDFAFALLVGVASGAYSSIFIAAPVLTHWKDKEPVYKARRKRIREEMGHVPAYAAASQSEPVETERARIRSRQPAPVGGAPGEVSREEFDEMVRDLGLEQERPAGPARPSGGRRARARDQQPDRPETREGGGPEDKRPAKRSPGRRHGRPR